MRVQVHAADMGGCGHYRAIWPALAVQANGGDVTVFSPENPATLDCIWQDINGQPHVIGMRSVPECDVIVLQRPLRRQLVETIPQMQRAGIAVVVEVDDDFGSMHPRNVAWRDARQPDRNNDMLKLACGMADLVTVTTDRLADVYAKHGRVRVIPNYVPESYLSVHPHPSPLTARRLGWAGSLASHPNDVKEARAAAKLIDGTRTRFVVAGNGAGVAKELGLNPTRLDQTEWCPLPDYPQMVADNIDIGIVPLAPSAFNEAKSSLKGLEYAALGIPFVASPTTPYRSLSERGIGTLAVGNEWRQRVLELLDDDSWIEEGRRLRQAVDDQSLIIERQWTQWAEAWGIANVIGTGRKAAAERGWANARATGSSFEDMVRS